MGGTTRLPAWWAPNAPGPHAPTSGRSGAPRPLGAPLCGPPQDQAGVPRDLRETQPPGQGRYVTANAPIRPLRKTGRCRT